MKCPHLSELDDSPLFAASLGSKELFHSNFIGFLIKKEPNLALHLFNVDLGDNPKIERELKHADLVISGNGNKIVIENKVKDVAKPKQLSEISERFKDATLFVLLSFLGENIEQSQLGKWWEISYHALVEVLSKISFKDEYLSRLVIDYVGFVKVLLRELSDLRECDAYWFYRTDNPNMDVWKAYRLHDLYMKYGLSIFSSKATEVFSQHPGVSIETSINNSKPTITFTSRVRDKIVCVQIEDNQYRRAIIGTESDRTIFEEAGWFSPHYKSAQGKNYLQYSGGEGLTFYYQIIDYDVKDKKFVELIELVKNDLMKFSLT